MKNMKKRNRTISLLLMPAMVFVWALGWILYNLETKGERETRKTVTPNNLGKTSMIFSRSLVVEKPARIDPSL